MTSVYIYQRSLTGSLQTKTTGSGVWNYGYDLTDQLTSEQFSNQQSSIYNQQFSYDPMGNRLFSRERTQGTQKETAYEPNRLNQYTSISNSVLPAPSSLLYDLNGNLTNDSVRAYSWDTRNELIKVEPLSLTPSNGALKVEFAYDAFGRRIRKDVYSYSSQSQWSKAQSLLFFYDGWNLVREIELNPQSEIVNQKSYVWGNDLSGSLQGAGGVGGLLCTISKPSAPGSTPQAFFPCYDHNGNVEKVIRGNGQVAAEYQYDAFGNTIQESIAQGLRSKDFPVRFSTKYFDAETGLAYYGYRYYSPEKGRWINRDPLEEEGGRNLYGFVENRPVNKIDLLGREIVTKETSPAYRKAIIDAFGKLTGAELVWSTRVDGSDVLIVAKEGNGILWDDFKKAKDSPYIYEMQQDSSLNNAVGSWYPGHPEMGGIVSINENTVVYLPEYVGVDANGKAIYMPVKAEFAIILWHEFMGHAVSGLPHLTDDWNVYELVECDSLRLLDSVIGIENIARAYLKLRPRRGQYFDTVADRDASR